jgi:hypothetical protein
MKVCLTLEIPLITAQVLCTLLVYRSPYYYEALFP